MNDAAPQAEPLVAIVLPPREGFGPVDTGAVGLVVRNHAMSGGGRVIAVGPPQRGPVFAGIAYRAAQPSRLAPLAGRYAAGVARVLRALRPDLIEVHNRPEVARALARRFPRIPVLLFLHNDPRGMRGAGGRLGRARLLGKLASVVCVSAHIARRLAADLPRARPPVVLPNPIDFSSLPPPRSAADRDQIVLFAGRVVADKGADLFVAAWARAAPRLPGWRAEILGADRFRDDSPETPYLAALRPEAAAAGVALPGYRPHASVLAALAETAIAVVPSRWEEPFGLAALEAMACGAALIASPRGGLPEVVGEAAVLVDPADTGAFADTIVALARDPARRAALSDAGRARAALFGLDAIGPRLAAMRRSVLADWPRARPLTIWKREPTGARNA
jgi:glycosyltransferase involved in cell wall biosynthesis